MAALSLVAAACGDDDGNGPDNVAPTANFEPPACTQLSCQFTDSSSDPDGQIASRSWEFESGTPASSEEQNPTAVFSGSGTYTVTLTVTDNEGATDDFEREVTVNEGAPTAAFTLTCGGLDCTFTDGSSDADGSIASWQWDFGDGQESTEQSPTHSYTFTEATEVTVTLTVTDDDGNTGEHSETFDVVPPSGLECADGTPNCELTIEADAKVLVTLTSSDCELSGNTFKVLITPPGGGTPVEETLFEDGCSVPDGTSFQLQSDATIAAGTIITAQLISGGSNLEIPPALRLDETINTYPTWELEFDDGARAFDPVTDPDEPDFNDLVITITATPQ